MKFGTKVIHAGVEPDPSTGAIMTPIFQTSTYVQSGDHQVYHYARSQNPTRTVLENNLAALENGALAVCFGSGLAAMDAVLKLLKPGDEVVSTNDLYGGSYRLMTQVFADYGIKFHFVGMDTIEKIDATVNENTKMIWIETPTNPMLSIIDIEMVCQYAKDKGIQVCVDNTFATPYLQNPIDLGADIIIHSATKYLGGHSDVVHGAVITRDIETGERLRFIQNAVGAIPGPQDCFLVLRGIKTLHVRVQRACENAMKIAQFALAESLGGVESLIGHPATMTHGSIPREERLKIGLTDSLVRLSVGIEDVDDLIHDLAIALSKT